MPTDVSTLDDSRLFAAEDGLHQMFAMRKDAHADTSDIESAFDTLTLEMAERGLVWAPLTKSKVTDPKHILTDDGKRHQPATITNDDQVADASAGLTAPGDGDDGATGDGDTRQKRKKSTASLQAPDGPVVKKKKGKKASRTVASDGAKGSIPTVNRTFPDDGVITRGGTKSGKGGESGRTQVNNGAKGAPPKGGGRAGDGPILKKSQYRSAYDAGQYTPHMYVPLDKAASPKNGQSHSFVPVRNFCKICRQGIEDHVSKALGYDGSMFKAVSDDTIDDRKGGADAGLALPDGSFYIPDEAHLHQAIRLVGQAPDPQTAMNHIIERAQAMGLESALPPAWRGQTAAGMPSQPQVGPGANTLAAQQGATTPPGAPGSKTQTAPGAGPTQQRTSRNILKRIRKSLTAAHQFDEAEFVKTLEANLDPEFAYAVVKSRGEDRFTLGPVYMPNTLDAHGEWATAEDLQKSIWDYVAETGADRRVFLQHSPKPAGEWVEIVSWPQEVKARMLTSSDVSKATETTFPAGTVYMGVRWADWAWEDVKKGKITGFSMGGNARRIEALPE